MILSPEKELRAAVGMDRHLRDQQAPCLFIPNLYWPGLATQVLHIFLHTAYPHQPVLLFGFQTVELHVGFPEPFIQLFSLSVESRLFYPSGGMFPDEGFVHPHHRVDLLLAGGDFHVQRCRVLQHGDERFAILDDRFPVPQEQVVGLDEQRLDVILG